MAQFEQVPGRQLAATDIIDRGRAQLVVPSVAIEQDRRHAPGRQLGHFVQVVLGGRDQKAVHPVFLEHPQVAALPLGGLVGRAHHEHIALVPQHTLGAPHHLGEERVGNVQEHHAYRAALADTELMGGGAPHEARLLNGVEDAPAGRGGDHPKTLRRARPAPSDSGKSTDDTGHTKRFEVIIINPI